MVPANFSAETKLQMGRVLHQDGRLREAEIAYQEVLLLDENNADALYLMGGVYYQTQRYEQAVDFISQAINRSPNAAVAHFNLANAFTALNRLDEAIASYGIAIQIKPDYAEACNNRGNAFKARHRFPEALADYDWAIALKPDYAEAYKNRGTAFYRLNRLDEALADYDRAIALRPDIADYYCDRGIVLNALKRANEAIASYYKAVELKPDYAAAFYNLGNALQDRPENLEDALACYNRAIQLRSNWAEAYHNRGTVLETLKRFDDALADYDRAIALKPQYAETHNNRGNVHNRMRRLGEALTDYDRAIALKPEYTDAWTNRGNLLNDLKRPTEALVSLERAIALNPRHGPAWGGRGLALYNLDRANEAAASFEKAFTINPQDDFFRGYYLHSKMRISDWDGFDDHMAKCVVAIQQGKSVIPPWSLLCLLDDPALHYTVARNYSTTKYPSKAKRPSPRPRSEKIRIGYYSGDFHSHAVSYLIVQMLEAHDQGQFELYGFSIGPERSDDMRKRVSAAFHKFIDVRGMTDDHIARLSRELGIDIAVDLSGHTRDSRPGIFAEGCAPIQAQYLGYPGTMGADYIDYVIADRTVLPPESLGNYAEKAVWLPRCYQANDSTRKISGQIFTRQEERLPPSGFVFCCFNNRFKMLPKTFDVWMRILQAVDGSVLWLMEDNPTASENLRKEAKARGVDPARLVFANFLPSEEHLARHRLADLFLDTWPYNAHTTASDALWAGLPVLTCMGKSFASRVAASLLSAVGLPEMITRSTRDYEAAAIDLALHPDKLAALKKKLAENRTSSSLFNGKLIARHIEEAYKTMLERATCGLPSANIEIAF